VYGRVKLCGLRRPEELQAALPATYAGLVFVPAAPRSVSLADALRLTQSAWPRRVGVFRDDAVAKVAETASLLGLSAVQLHGSEDPGYVRALARLLPSGCEVWKALTVGGSRPGTFDAADRLLFDAGSGGTGRTFDWKLVRGHGRLAESIARHSRLSRAIVAGGIGPGNAREAMALGAHAIDVGSSLDEVPGRKSTSKIAALFDALRAPCRQGLRICA
jgi:indole-3-glycerol phosphate synthase/phosphoribosylanthranilate isomerase